MLSKDRLALSAPTFSSCMLQSVRCTGDDYDLQTGQYIFQPTAEDNITISLHVIEDEVAEGSQQFTWSLSQPQLTTKFFDVIITDNDGMNTSVI